MKGKLLVLFFLLIVLSGCKASYYLEIKPDDSAEDQLTIYDYEKYYEGYDIIDVLPSNSEYDFGNEEGFVVTRKLDRYINLYKDNAISNYFGDIKIDSNKLSFEPDYDKCIFLFSDGGEYVTDDTINISVKVPFKVKSSNASKVENDVYTWTYGINDCKTTAYIELSNSVVGVGTIVFAVILICICVICIILKKRNAF